MLSKDNGSGIPRYDPLPDLTVELSFVSDSSLECSDLVGDATCGGRRYVREYTILDSFRRLISKRNYTTEICKRGSKAQNVAVGKDFENGCTRRRNLPIYVQSTTSTRHKATPDSSAAVYTNKGMER